MHGFKGERTLMRIHIGERDKWHGRPLHQAIVELLRAHHNAGATVVRGVMGFGASTKLHTDRVELLSLDLPLVIECIDTEERIAAILPELDEMIGGGLITLERARVIMYRADLPPDERTESGRSSAPAAGSPTRPTLRRAQNSGSAPEQEQQARGHHRGLDERGEGAGGHPVEDSLPRPAAGEHHGAERQADQHAVAA